MKQITKYQQNIFEMDRATQNSTANICGGFIFNKTNALEYLSQVINLIIEKNNILRTRIKINQGKIMQEYIPYEWVDFPVLSFDTKEKYNKWAERESQKPIDIYNQLMEITLFTIGGKQSGAYCKIHHIIADAWTIRNLGKWVADNYEKYMNGESLEINCSQYDEFMEREKVYLSSDTYKTDQKFWTELIKENSDIHYFCEQVTLDTTAQRYEAPVSQEISQKVKDFCKKNRLSELAFFMAVTGLYLYKIKSYNKFYLGTPVINRTGPKEKQSCGMFVNTLPVLTECNGQNTVNEVLININGNLYDAYRHHKYCYSDLLARLREDGFKEVLFDTVVNYHIIETLDNNYDNIEPESYFQGNQTFSLIINIDYRLTQGYFHINYDYQIEKLKEDDIKNLHNYILNIINEVTDNPSKIVDDVEILLEDEKNKLINVFNNTYTIYPKDKTIIEMFEEQAAKIPDETAVIFENQQMSYQELRCKVNEVASALYEQGVRPGHKVAMLLTRALSNIVIQLSVLKVGAVFVPIDTNNPEQRISHILKDSEAKFLIKNRNSDYNHKDETCKTILYEELKQYKESVNFNFENSAEAPCYVIYTSGSTGLPKGCILTHRGIVNFCINNNILDTCEKLSRKIGVAVNSVAFDFFIAESLLMLLNGYTVVLANERQQINQAEFRELVIRTKANIIQTTPTRLSLFIEDDKQIDFMEQFDIIVLSGEELKPSLFRRLQKIARAKIFNPCGPSEASVWALGGDIFDCQENEEIKIHIGKPIANVQVYILDKNQKLLPLGMPGELCIAGDGVGLGYINKEVLTKEKFIDNPFGNGKLYRTGDLARWRSDGNIEYLGRIDDQIKIRGLRIELGEIDNTIRRQKGIKDAAVIARTDENGDKYLCAYVVADETIDLKALKSEIKKTLPDYMVPNHMMQIDSLPINRNGKLDKKALPEITMTRDNVYEAPRNEIEETLCEIFAEVLELERVGISDDFFELGGHSLKATGVINLIEHKMGVKLPLRTIFAHSAVKELGEVISKEFDRKDEPVERFTMNAPVPKKEYYLASPAQRRIYLLACLEGSSEAYDIPGMLLLEGKLDYTRLENALFTLVNRHESLRTSFENRDAQIVQRIHDEVDFKVEFFECAETEVNHVIKDFLKPFDLSKAPLFRAGLFKIGKEKHLLVLHIHHIISDGTSLGVILKEFSTLYRGDTLADLPLQYKDFSEWQNQMFESDEMKKQKEYWLNVLSDEIPVLNMPTDFQRPAVQSFEGNSLYFEIEEELCEQLKALATSSHATLFMTLLCSYTILLHKYSGQEDIIVGSSIAGRTHANFQKVVGLFVNSLPMRNYPKGEKTVREFLNEVTENALKAYEYQDYQFEEFNTRRELSRNPLFDTLLILQNEDRGEIHIPGLKVKPYDYDITISKFDITMDAEEVDSKLVFRLEYCTKLYKQETMEHFIEHFKNIIKEVVKNPDKKIGDINILSEEEKNQILYVFNAKKSNLPAEKTIHEMFEEQVRRTPDHIALVYGDEQLTYEEVNKKANSLAWYLKEKGVCPDTIVGILSERCAEMIIGILGILKAGGAYLPIDPEYPSERIQYMINDSHMEILLTQKQYDLKVEGVNKKIYLDDSLSYSDHSSNLKDMCQSHNLAYIIYTSGSTGKPKGVMIEHRNVIAYVTAFKDEFHITKEDVVLQQSTSSFDTFVEEVYPVLLNGGKLVIASKYQVLNPNSLVEIIQKNNICIISATPLLINEINKIELPKSIRTLISGGDVLRKEYISDLINKSKIYNTYGPTETTVCATYYKCEKNDDHKLIPIGKPIANYKVYIMGKDKQINPVGVPGEICIAGPGVARGYLNNEKLTEEKFVKNPIDTSERMYCSGDIGKWLPDGNIEFLGRLDDQIKIRGFRIEIGEIEAQLLKHKDIKEAIVTAREDGKGSYYLCAYFVSDNKLTVTELRSYLSKLLAEYMIPSYFIQVDEMPLTANGKIDRKALPVPDKNITTGTEYEAPSDEIEEKLVAIWQDILEIQNIGVNDNFFELGGHSLKATILLTRIHKEFNVEIPLKEIFITQTIKEQAYLIKISDSNQCQVIEKAKEKPYYPLSPAQRRLYILDQLDAGTTAYNLPTMMVVEGPLDKEKIERAFKILIQRHDTLRTSFDTVDGEPVQKIHDHVNFDIDYITCSEREVDHTIETFIRPFNLEEAPLVRLAIITISDSSNKYMLLFDMHHIISDGTSMAIFKHEFIKLYTGTPLPELRLQYKDYSEWQNRVLIGEVLEKQKNYWLTLFKGEIPLLNMPTDYKRPAVQSFEGDVVRFSVGKDLLLKLKSLAKERGITLYMILLGAYNLLLHKYTGQEDIVVGSSIAARPHSDLQNIIGMFVNTLPMRNYPEADKTIEQFLYEVKDNALNAYENQDYQFEELNVRRDLSRNPLYDTLFIMQNQDIKNIEIDGLKFSPYIYNNKASKFDMTLEAFEFENFIAFDIEYCTKLFKKETMIRFSQHYIKVLEQIASDIKAKIGSAKILTKEEEETILYKFNDNDAEYPLEKTFHELFEEQVQKTPDNIAVTFEGQHLTYRELNEKANQLARVLRGNGVGRETITGIMVDRSLEVVIGMLAIMKAGGAYLPIDPDYPEDRIRHMVTDSQISVLLTQKHLREDKKFYFLSSFDLKVFELDNDQLYAGDSSNLKNINTSRDLVYIIYTSGTTGKPKGVMIEHQNFINVCHGWREKYKLDQTQVRLLQIASFSFDVFAGDIGRTLLYGGQMVICPFEARYSPSALYALIKEYKINIFESTPALVIPLMNYVYEEQLDIDCLKTLIIGSDTVPYQEFAALLSRYGKKMRIINSYGVTEACIDSSFYEGSLDELPDMGNVPIGKPLPNSKYYILDVAMQVQPIGVLGELYIGGKGVARGYLNREDLTSEKFLPDPFIEGEKMYQTGDMARWLPNGDVEFIGRADNQVKIRGYRIELGEIETQLLKHSEVKEVVVVSKTSSDNTLYLCAYFVANKELSAESLKKYLSKVLPEYMIPAKYMQLEKMPLTPNGKVDRKALPQPDNSVENERTYQPPSNKIEEELVKLWKDVLQLETIGVNDNFFELGGHSLKIAILTSKINKAFNVEIPIKEIFTNQTIRQQASYLKTAKESTYQPIVRVEEKPYYPLSSAQKRLYILNRLEGPSTAYNLPDVLVLEGILDYERLNNSLNAIIKRHSILRTSFSMIEGEPVQKIHDTVDFNIEHIEYKEDVLKIIRNFIRPFDLERAPLLRVGLIKVTDSKHIFIFDMHHIVSDGISIDILVKEFMSLYNGFSLPEMEIQYVDFVMWQNQMLTSEVIHKQENYWLDLFKDEIPVLNLPTDYPRQRIQSYEGDKISFKAGAALTKKLRSLSLQSGTTLYMILLGTYNILLHKYTGQEDIIVGSPIAGRPRAELENLIGMFVNTLAMRNYPNGDKTVSEFLQEVKINALEAYENQDYQFEELVDKLHVKRDLSRNPLFDTVFVLQNEDIRELELDGLICSGLKMEHTTSKFDLTLEAFEINDEIEFSFEYCIKLFNNATIEKLAKHYINLLEEVADNASRKIADLQMLSNQEQHELLFALNNTEADYPKDKTIHKIFEEQVIKYPDNTAIVFENQSLSYRELNEKANQLANLLRKKGIKRDSIVALMIERSLEMMIGILAILKAGGAYLPIDPDYPPDRIDYMLNDSQASILLTQSFLENRLTYDGEMIYLDDEGLYTGSSLDLPDINLPGDLAYIIYTSGTTGKPKGVMIEHKNVVSLLYNDKMQFDFDSSDIWTMFHSQCFDFSVWEMYGALLYGGKLVIVPKLTAKNTRDYLELLKREKVTVLNQTPTAFYHLSDEEMLDQESKLAVRYVIFGGEALKPSLLKGWKEKYPQTKLINMYGITETTVHVTYKEITDEEIKTNTSNIGRPIPTLTTYIMDKYLKIVPVGVAGELCVGGAGVGRGYLNRPELTHEKFIENPYKPGERIYRSGDLARILPSGDMEYLGRIDHQVKIRGFRIELGEIENQLLLHEEIKEAIVVAKEDSDGNSYLCAYFTSGSELSVTELRKYLSLELPDYMIPSYFVRIEKMPLTSNEKVNKKMLPEPKEYLNAKTTYEAPTDEIEEGLVKIWCEVLNLEHIGIEDNFFELGGHSLRATILSSKIHKTFDVEMPLKEIFMKQTIKDQANYIRNTEKNRYVSIKPLEEQDYYPMSSAQKRLYILSQMQEAASAYNMPEAISILGKLDRQRLNHAVDELIKRHEALRTSLHMINGEPVQKINKTVDFAIDYYEVQEDRTKDIVWNFIKPFDLEKAPLFRVALIKFNDNKHLLLFDMHHIISDGVSMGILVREFMSLYNGESLPALKIQYKDFAVWQNDFLKSSAMSKQEAFWLEIFKEKVPVLNLKTDYLRPEVSSYEGERVSTRLTKELALSLKELAQSTDKTLFMILLGAYNVLLSKLSGQDDIVVGVPVAGRHHADLENVIGIFVNFVAMRNFPKSHKSFRSFLDEVGQRTLNAYENQDYQFDMLVGKLNIERNSGRSPLFDVVLVFQNMDIQDIKIGDLEFNSYPVDKIPARYDITMNIQENKGYLNIGIDYRKDLFKKTTMNEFLQSYIYILQLITKNVDVLIKDIVLLDEKQKEEVLSQIAIDEGSMQVEFDL